jgi:hypothetical protein
VRLGAALTSALLATLATPSTWLLALGTFLLRGGILLVLLPILVLPSPVGLGNLLAPLLMTVVFQGLSVEVGALAVAGTIVVVAWIVLGGLAAATLEAEASRIVARGEADVDAAGQPFRPPVAWEERAIAWRVVVARIVAHAPTGGLVVWGSARLIAVAYAELTRPADVSSPIVLRVLLGAPDVVILLAVAWSFGEVVGALATRRIVLAGATTAGALREALRVLIRHPVKVVAAFLIPTIGLAFVLATSSVAAAVAWSAVRVAMRPPGELVLGTVAVVAFVSLWLVGLVLIAVTAGWRGAVWSMAHVDLWPYGARPTSVTPG